MTDGLASWDPSWLHSLSFIYHSFRLVTGINSWAPPVCGKPGTRCLLRGEQGIVTPSNYPQPLERGTARVGYARASVTALRKRRDGETPHEIAVLTRAPFLVLRILSGLRYQRLSA